MKKQSVAKNFNTSKLNSATILKAMGIPLVIEV